MRPFTGTVAITGLNAIDNPGPGVAFALALRRDPAFQGRIVGLAYDVLDPGLYLPHLLDASFLIPYPSAGRDALLSRLEHVRSAVGLDVLVPNLDSELPALMGHEDALLERGIATFLPTRGSFDARAKNRLDDLRAEHGIPVPEGEAISDPSPLYTAHERYGFPLVVKSGFYGARVCWSVDEAVRAFHALAAKWGLPIYVQRYVAGDEVNVCALGDGEGGTLGAVAMKKTVITELGKGWAGVTIEDEALIELARDVIRATRWRGPCEIEAIRDADGDTWLIEVNPRFPAWCDLCQGAGQNLPLATCRLAAGQPVAPFDPYQPGIAFVRVSTDLIVPIGALEALTVAGESIPASRRTA